MKSKISINRKPVPEVKLSDLLILEEADVSFVVMVTDPNPVSQNYNAFHGVVVWSNYEGRKVGSHCAHLAKDQFKRFAGKVTLEQ